MSREILGQNFSLIQYKEPKVKQVFGPEAETLPTSWQIQQKMGLKSVAPIFASLGIKVGSFSGSKISDFLAEDCPVPVFSHESRHAIFDECEEELKKFIIQKLGEL